MSCRVRVPGSFTFIGQKWNANDMLIALTLIAMILLIILGAPIFAAMGVASMIHYLDVGRISAGVVLVQRLFQGLTGFAFLAVPMFLLAGEIMTRGGLTDRLVRLARAIVGHVTGGLAQVNVLSSVFFGGISGSAHADVAAVGSLLIPAMKKEGYPTGFAGALTAVTGTLSPMIPPSIVLIIYGSTFNVSIGALFAAGLSIALFLAAVYMVLTYFLVRGSKTIPTRHPRASKAEFWDATKQAFPALGMPLIVVGGIFFGYFTATEAAAIAVLYSLVITVGLYRSIQIRDLPGILKTAALTSAAVAILVGVAISFSYVMVRRQVPQAAAQYVLSLTDSPVGIAVLILILLLIAGMFIDRTANILLFGGILIPIFTGVLGYSPVHTAMIIVMALGVGHMTPPVGGTLLTTALVGKMSVMEITRYVWPYIILEIGVTMIVILFAPLSEFLPRLLGFGGV